MSDEYGDGYSAGYQDAQEQINVNRAQLAQRICEELARRINETVPDELGDKINLEEIPGIDPKDYQLLNTGKLEMRFDPADIKAVENIIAEYDDSSD